MNKFVFMVLIVVFVLSGCSTYYNGKVIPGTTSLVVQIPVDTERARDNIKVTRNKVTVKKGQQVVFVGPKEFELRIDEKDDIFGLDDYTSKNGVLILPVPSEINNKRVKFRNGELRIKYDVVYKNFVLDPYLIVPE